LLELQLGISVKKRPVQKGVGQLPNKIYQPKELFNSFLVPPYNYWGLLQTLFDA